MTVGVDDARHGMVLPSQRFAHEALRCGRVLLGREEKVEGRAGRNSRELISQLWEVFHGLFNPIVGHVIGSWFGAQAQVIADILLEEAVSIMTANHRVRKIQILDDRLKFSLVVLGDLATEDRGNLVGFRSNSKNI